MLLCDYVLDSHRMQAHTAHSSRAEALNHLEDAWKGYFNVLEGKLGMTGMRLRVRPPVALWQHLLSEICSLSVRVCSAPSGTNSPARSTPM